MDEDRLKLAAELLRQSKRTVALTGAGVSAESGVPTFRGEQGLWKQFRAEELATPEAFSRNPALVWEWYDWRRTLIAEVMPNPGHKTLARWEKILPGIFIITQNIDGLHQRTGSANVLELHGNIWKLRCTKEESVSENLDCPLKEIPPRCPNCGSLLRPHVVWFGEPLFPAVIGQAFAMSSSCDLMLIIGTSAVVHPAASLPLAAADADAKIIEINPDPTPLTSFAHLSFRGKAGEILPRIDLALGKAVI